MSSNKITIFIIFISLLQCVASGVGETEKGSRKFFQNFHARADFFMKFSVGLPRLRTIFSFAFFLLRTVLSFCFFLSCLPLLWLYYITLLRVCQLFLCFFLTFFVLFLHFLWCLIMFVWCNITFCITLYSVSCFRVFWKHFFVFCALFFIFLWH